MTNVENTDNLHSDEGENKKDEQPDNSQPGATSENTDKQSEPEQSSETTGDISFEDAINLDAPNDEDAFLELEDASHTGRGAKWEPDSNPNRPVVVKSPKCGSAVFLRLACMAKSTKGGYMASYKVESQFDVRFRRYEHRKQMTLLLANGKSLPGYVFKTKSRCGIYFPEHQAKDIVAFPPFGKILPVKVAKLIIG